MRPPTVIVDRLGQDNAARLSTIAGGRRLSVPGRLANAGRLKALLGDDLAVLVILHFGDSRIYVPRGQRSAPVDAKRVDRLTRKGWSASRIAEKLGCSDRTVHSKRAAHTPRTNTRKKIGVHDGGREP